MEFHWISPEAIQWERYRKIFTESYSHQFRNFSLEQLSAKVTQRADLFEEWYNLEATYETTTLKRNTIDPQFKFYFLEVQVEFIPVAYAIWHFDPAQNEPLYLSSLAVLPQYQRKGLGLQMAYAIREKQPEARNFTLNTRSSEINRAHHFLKRALNCKQIPVIPEESLEDPTQFTGYICPL